MVRGYKVLSHSQSVFTGFRWPLPEGECAGAWVETPGPPALCANGIHAATSEQLPHWLGDDLWEIELDGEILHQEVALVASRARLVRKVEAWDEEMRRRFAQTRFDRAQELAADYPAGGGLVAKVEHTIWWAGAAPAGYFCAMLAGERATGRHSGEAYDRAFKAERAVQADWLRAQLQLDD